MSRRGKAGAVRVEARVALVTGAGVEAVTHLPGAFVEVPAEEAARLIAAGFAAPAEAVAEPAEAEE